MGSEMCIRDRQTIDHRCKDHHDGHLDGHRGALEVDLGVECGVGVGGGCGCVVVVGVRVIGLGSEAAFVDLFKVLCVRGGRREAA